MGWRENTPTTTTSGGFCLVIFFGLELGQAAFNLETYTARLFFFNGCLVTQLLLMEEIQHQLVDSL